MHLHNNMLMIVVIVCLSYSLDPAMSFKGLSRALVPELAVDQQPATASLSSSSLPLPKDCDLDTESTVL